jgi:hypothetical protein
MRIVLSALLASSLLLGTSNLAIAADKIKIEIVETTTTIGLVPRTFPGTPEEIRTHCSVLVDVNCNSTVTPATDPSSGFVPEVLSFEVKAVLPDGSHVKLACSPSRVNKRCGGIVPVAGSTPDSANCFLDAMVAHAPAVGTTKSCTARNLGFYRARWGNDKSGLMVLRIYESGGKKEYRMTGSW